MVHLHQGINDGRWLHCATEHGIKKKMNDMFNSFYDPDNEQSVVNIFKNFDRYICYMYNADFKNNVYNELKNDDFKSFDTIEEYVYEYKQYASPVIKNNNCLENDDISKFIKNESKKEER